MFRDGSQAYSRIKWTTEMIISFLDIKRMIADAIAMRTPDVDKDLVLVTDRSNIAAGAMLAQVDEEDKERLAHCAFFHHALSSSEKDNSATEKGLLAIVLSVERFLDYLSKQLEFITDHQAHPENETGSRGRVNMKGSIITVGRAAYLK